MILCISTIHQHIEYYIKTCLSPVSNGCHFSLFHTLCCCWVRGRGCLFSAEVVKWWICVRQRRLCLQTERCIIPTTPPRPAPSSFPAPSRGVVFLLPEEPLRLKTRTVSPVCARLNIHNAIYLHRAWFNFTGCFFFNEPSGKV